MVTRASGVASWRWATMLVCGMWGAGPIASAVERPWSPPFAQAKPGSLRPDVPSARGVYVDRARIGLGEAVTITVIRKPEPAPLDLGALARDFELREVNRGEGDGLERWSLVVHPRGLGRLALPTWGLPGPAVAIDVGDGSPGAPRMRVRWLDPEAPLHERQGAMLVLQACTDGALQWQRPVLPALGGALLRLVGESEMQTEVDGLRCTATRWRWSLLPTAAGTLPIRPPTLQATRFGQVLRLPAPGIDVEVAAVPGWLPPEVAIGPVTVEVVSESEPDPAAAAPARAIVGEPWPLRLRVRANLSPEALRRILQTQLAAAPEWSRYPIDIDPMPDGGPTPLWRVNLHAAPERAGTLRWPALDWTWFDPATQRLMSSRSATLGVDVDDPVRRRWLQLAGAVATLATCALVGFGAWRRQSWRWRRARLAQAMRRARTVGELSDLLLAFQLQPERGHPQRAGTLGEWWRAFAAGSRSADPSAWLDALQQRLYGRVAPDCPDIPPPLRQQVLDWLSTVSPGRPLKRTSAD